MESRNFNVREALSGLSYKILWGEDVAQEDYIPILSYVAELVTNFLGEIAVLQEPIQEAFNGLLGIADRFLNETTSSAADRTASLLSYVVALLRWLWTNVLGIFQTPASTT